MDINRGFSDKLLGGKKHKFAALVVFLKENQFELTLIQLPANRVGAGNPVFRDIATTEDEAYRMAYEWIEANEK